MPTFLLRSSSIRNLLTLSTVLALSACGSATRSSETPAEQSETPAEPAIAESAEPEGQHCHLVNETTHQLEIVDTAIEEVIGTIEPAATGQAGGHFMARTTGGLSVQGFCPTGHRIRIVEQSDGLRALDRDGEDAIEGEGE